MEKVNMSNANTDNSKKVDIKVHIADDPTNYPPEPPYEYWLETDDSNIGKKKGKALIFNNEQNGRKYDGFDIIFEIVDHTRKDFKFMDIGALPNGDPDPNCAPMWVRTVKDFGDTCPDHQFWDQFTSMKVYAGNKKLHVRNMNDCKQLFKFALMFSRNPSQGPCEIMYDPDGTNQNGAKQ